jgi:hypothetical protein
MSVDSPPRRRRGLELLLAHCAALDVSVPPARERLEQAVGPELARRLVFAPPLSPLAARDSFAA